KLEWLAGLYYLKQESKTRYYRWAMWEFFVPNTGPGLPALNVAARDYVRAYGALVGNPQLATFNPLNISVDQLTANEDEDTAFFGEATYNVTDRLALTYGVRITADEGEARTYIVTDGFRPMSTQLPVKGDLYGGIVDTITPD